MTSKNNEVLKDVVLDFEKLLGDEYQVVKEISRGGYGVVYLGFKNTAKSKNVKKEYNRPVAVKLFLPHLDYEMIQKEVNYSYFLSFYSQFLKVIEVKIIDNLVFLVSQRFQSRQEKKVKPNNMSLDL